MFNDDTQADDLVNTSEDTDETEVTEEVEDTTDWKAEALKFKAIAERKAKKAEEQTEHKAVTVDTSDALLARLEARGIVDPEIQDYLIGASKREGKHPVELLNDSYFKDRIDGMKKASEQKQATPTPGNRTPETKKDVNYWVKQVEAGKANSPDPDMRRQVRAAIIAKS